MAAGLNWLLAHSLPSPVFSYTSMAIFVWGMIYVTRYEPIAAVLLAPFLISRASVMVSLAFIEAGSYIPEIDVTGHSGDFSASFALYTIISWLAFAFTFKMLKRYVLFGDKSRSLSAVVKYSSYPILLVLLFGAAYLFYFGQKNGFPTLQGMDRFAFRRNYADPIVIAFIIYKWVPSLLLGTILFKEDSSRIQKFLGCGIFSALLVAYFLFGDKFFTMLISGSFFAMPYLIRKSSSILSTALKLLPYALIGFALAVGMTLFIYSGYGKGNTGVGFVHLQERMTEQAELWYIENNAAPDILQPDTDLIKRNLAYLAADDPDTFADKQGLATQYFAFKYQMKKDLAEREHYGVTLTMGYEPMGLAMFGYVGMGVFMAISGALFALFALLLYRAIDSGLWFSISWTTWAYIVVIAMSTQATFAQLLGPHAMRRWLILIGIELALLALNTSQKRMAAGGQIWPFARGRGVSRRAS